MGQDERREPRSAVFLLYTAVPPLVRPDPGRWSVGVLLSEIRYVSLREAPYSPRAVSRERDESRQRLYICLDERNRNSCSAVSCTLYYMVALHTSYVVHIKVVLYSCSKCVYRDLHTAAL